MSLRSDSSLGHFQLSSARRSSLRTTLRKFEEQSSRAATGKLGQLPLVRLQILVPLLLVPLIMGFLILLSIAKAFGCAMRWMIVWISGFVAGGFLAWALGSLTGASYSRISLWAAGGFLGLVVLSSLYGMCLEWIFWLSRHEPNPYAGTVSLSPQQESDRVAFAKSLHWPSALASAAGGFSFSALLFPIIAGTQTEPPSIFTWIIVGSIALGLQGFLLGLFLGWKRNRVRFDASKHSLGEYVGWRIAGTRNGKRAALGWSLGYALHQLPTGAIAGLFLGGITRLFL